MSSNNVMIKVERVYKDFKLPHLRKNTIKSIFTSLFERDGTKSFESQHTLENISFEIEKGEFFGIVGRNGSGKSTLLKILAGIYQPTSGNVHVSGKLVPFIELGVGFNPELTGRENVYLNGALLGFSKDEIDDLYDDIVEFAELEKFMDQKLKNYSSGMQVRLAFSMATRAKTDILIVDEVLAVGDADFQRKCFDYFKTLKKNGTTVVFVTHDMSAVREYCDRAMLIDKNKIVAIDKPSAISNKYSMLFQGSAKNSNTSSSRELDRWGTEVVRFEEIKIDKVFKEGQKVINFDTVIRAKEDISMPIVGFMIKDAEGRPLTGTNTKLMGMTLKNIAPNKKMILSWTLPNIFTDGKYSITFAINAEDGIGTYDWWEDAVKFQVFRDTHVPYQIMPEYKVSINEK